MICDGRFRGEADIHNHVASTASAVEHGAETSQELAPPGSGDFRIALRAGTGCDDMVEMTPTGNVGKHMLCGPRTGLLFITLAPTVPDSSRIA